MAAQRAAASAAHARYCAASGRAALTRRAQVLPGAPAARASVVEGAGRRSAHVGAPATFTVAARDAHGNACGGALADALPLEVLITSAGGSVAAQVTDTGRGLYVVTFTAQQARAPARMHGSVHAHPLPLRMC